MNLDDYLTMGEIAAQLGLKTRSIMQYRWRGDFPREDVMVLERPMWLPETVNAWLAQRPGMGNARTSRKETQK